MGRDVLGEFEHQVLLAIMRLGRESYSVPVVLELEECTGREISQSAVFVVLRRLEKKGLLTSRMDDNGDGESGRTRRYFALTPAALTRLQESRATFQRLWEGLQTDLDPS
ncbi:MAG: helix-turn-helix transcriptional regulator [Gemmatimonadales bacterium]|jgi:DNA-binding PadR family transcriptional regulator|nr:MAG: helix-turn-helix transcriptional regulator [Gemmatimonadales bacterium]